MRDTCLALVIYLTVHSNNYLRNSWRQLVFVFDIWPQGRGECEGIRERKTRGGRREGVEEGMGRGGEVRRMKGNGGKEKRRGMRIRGEKRGNEEEQRRHRDAGRDK